MRNLDLVGPVCLGIVILMVVIGLLVILDTIPAQRF